SGSGKSTLLFVMGLLDTPTSGSVALGGRDVGTLDDAARAALRREHLGFVFQDHHLLPQATALENVLVPTLILPAAEQAAAAERARELLGTVGLADRLDHRPAALSGGECQRVAVVRALINQPQVLLADEPTGSLDGRAAEQLGDLLGALVVERALALVTVTHADRLAARMRRTLVLADGVLAAPGGARA
ncbi:MAG: ATP-binding cassette domain-containing protein, partial [Planctomycetes bacterium]|nr:ATP-binding cassette domain-containing protein [Planctomycetota bacterium]